MHSHLLLAAEEAEPIIKLFFFHSLAEVLVSSLASVTVFWLLWWKGVPAARTMLEARHDRIAAEVEGAEHARRQGETRLAEVRQRVEAAGDERQRILVEARQTAEVLKAQILERAAADAEALKVRAAADIEASKQQVVADLQAEVAALALGAAEVIVTRHLDSEAQSDLIDGYIEQLGATAATTAGGHGS